MSFLFCWIFAALVAGLGIEGSESVYGRHDAGRFVVGSADGRDVIDDQQNAVSFNLNNVLEDVYKKVDDIKSKIEDLLGKRKHKKLDWWQKSVIYQIYPRSFKDTTGDGVGDLQGIIENIPYLKDLGIGAIWINPIYPTSGIDMGYDITDFRNVDELFGSMDDLEELTDKLHENGIKLILDFVPNHTSDKHEWFVKSIKKIEPYTDYYVWADAKYINGTKQVPNNWKTIFNSNQSMWTWNDERQQYYLHQFFTQMPDLNFYSPSVREEMKEVLRFWLDKGVDGFRVDALPHLYERQDLTDAPLDPATNYTSLQKMEYTQCISNTYEELKSWRSLLDEYTKQNGRTRLIVIESYVPSNYSNVFYGNSTHPGAHFPFNVILRRLAHTSAKTHVDILSKTMTDLPSKAWPCWVIGNHDAMHRAATLFGNELLDSVNMMQLLLPGTPVYYMADEYGMTDTYLRQDQLVDKPLNMSGIILTRDTTRTPFQWDSTAQAGFSNKTKTWLPVNPNYVTLNVDHQRNVQRSHLEIFKRLVKLRRLDAFRYGDVQFYEISDYVFAFSRSESTWTSYFVVINLGSEMENINLRKIKKMLPFKMEVIVASSYAEQNIGDMLNAKSFSLRPNAAVVLKTSYFKF